MPRQMFILLSLILLMGCGRGDIAPPPRPSGATAAYVPLPSERETRACKKDLSRMGVDYASMPDQDFGTGCSMVGAVRLDDVGIPVSGLKGMRCGVALAFSGWVRNAVAPAARQILRSDLVRIETFGSYSCRNVIGNSYASGRRSGHAIGNAVDVATFVLEDGRRITVERGWRSRDHDEYRFLQVIHASACKRFGTVLSPDYNYAHRNHFHLEDDHAGFCR